MIGMQQAIIIDYIKRHYPSRLWWQYIHILTLNNKVSLKLFCLLDFKFSLLIMEACLSKLPCFLLERDPLYNCVILGNTQSPSYRPRWLQVMFIYASQGNFQPWASSYLCFRTVDTALSTSIGLTFELPWLLHLESSDHLYPGCPNLFRSNCSL